MNHFKKLAGFIFLILNVEIKLCFDPSELCFLHVCIRSGHLIFSDRRLISGLVINGGFCLLVLSNQESIRTVLIF
jgi:hypothetical protein